MNIKDLANLDVKDLQNIDYSALLDELKKKPDIIIEILVVLVTIVMCFYFYGTKKDALKKLSQELKDLEQKEQIYNEYLHAEKIIKSLETVLPEALNESQMIQTITNSAKLYNINIESFSPVSKKDFPVYTTLSLSLELKIASYKDLWKFIYEIESQNQAIRIDKWAMGEKKEAPQNPRRRRAIPVQTIKENDEQLLTSTLTVSAVNFKNAS